MPTLSPASSQSASPPEWGRLRRGDQYQRVVKEGRRAGSKRVVLYVLPGERVARVGFATPRGVGGAVHRNRARRVLKEAWRTLAPRAASYDIVFVARPDIRGAKTQEIVEEMERALHALGVVDP